MEYWHGEIVLQKHYTAQWFFRKSAIRTINNAKLKSHTDPLFKATNIMKITDQYIFQSTLFVFDFITKYLPCSFEKMFIFNHDIPNSRVTRQCDILYEARCKTNFANKLPLYAIPKIWNKWFRTSPQNMSRSKFKYVMKANIVSAYQAHVTCTNSVCPDCVPQSNHVWEKLTFDQCFCQPFGCFIYYVLFFMFYPVSAFMM